MKKKIFSLLVVLVGVIVLTGCSILPTKNNQNSSNNTAVGTTKKVDVKKLEKNITSSAAMTEEGKLIVFVKNGNKLTVQLKVEVEFYDGEGKIIGSDKDDLFALEGGSEAAVEMYETPDNYAKYKIYTDVEEAYNTKSYVKDLEITHNKTDKVIAQVKNNSKEKIESMYVAVVFYQGDKVVGYDLGIESDVQPGRSANFNFYSPVNRNYDDVSFDNYKIFVNQAFSFTY